MLFSSINPYFDAVSITLQKYNFFLNGVCVSNFYFLPVDITSVHVKVRPCGMSVRCGGTDGSDLTNEFGRLRDFT